jgi:hypothetical protein
MSGRRLFDKDPAMGTTTYFHYDDDAGSMTLETLQETDDIVEGNKQDFNDAPAHWRGDMHKVASIPMTLYMQLKREGIIDDPRAFKRWLNDRDNRFFRTRPGKV